LEVRQLLKGTLGSTEVIQIPGQLEPPRGRRSITDTGLPVQQRCRFTPRKDLKIFMRLRASTGVAPNEFRSLFVKLVLEVSLRDPTCCLALWLGSPLGKIAMIGKRLRPVSLRLIAKRRSSSRLTNFAQEEVFFRSQGMTTFENWPGWSLIAWLVQLAATMDCLRSDLQL
jgi:hypothetical protein